MNAVDPGIVKNVSSLLDSHNPQLWESSRLSSVEGEDGPVLCVEVYVKSFPSPEQLDVIRAALIKAIHPYLPSYPSTQSWIAHIVFGDELIDSVMGGMGGMVL
jgi:hypothetical protein